MNTKQLKYVIVLARHKNFSRAAEELKISQPSLSQYIKKIETQVNSELFVRAGQNVRLTDAGIEFVKIAERMLSLENEINNRLIDITNYQTGRLTIGISPYRCASLMPRAIKEFHKFYPGIKVVLKEGVTSVLKEEAEKGRVDLCISTLPIDEVKFEYKSVMKEKTVLAVPKALDMESNQTGLEYKKIKFKKYKDLPFVSLAKNQIMGSMLENICEISGVKVNLVAECENLISVHSMVQAGVGVAILPYSLVKQHESVNVNYYLLEEYTLDREIVVFYKKDSYLTSPMLKMIEILTNKKEKV